jgi:hypothetical protein
MDQSAPRRPQFGIGSLVSHPSFGRGKVMDYTDDSYVVLFKGGEVRIIPFAYAKLSAEQAAGDPDSDRIKQAVREVLGDYGWIEADLEMGKRWAGGVVKLIPGKTDTQSKEVPVEAFFKKIVGIRDKLRVLEQKINAHAGLSAEQKLEFQGYLTRCYGSLTTFNVLFGSRESQFKGSGKGE